MTYASLMSKCGRLLLISVWLIACGRIPDESGQGREQRARSPLQAILGNDHAVGFHRAETVRQFRFPEDHGPHPNYRSEWWYLTGSLQDDQGQVYGVQFTAFRQALTPPDAASHSNVWRTHQVYMAHLALSDTTTERHMEDQRLVRAHPQLAGAQAKPFAVWVDGWTLASQGDGFLPLQLKAQSETFGIDLVISEGKPIVRQGDQGLSRKGPHQASYYYSMTRLPTTGTLRIGTRTVSVHGHTWLDREWSTHALREGQVGWDWFALQLDRGEEIMVYHLRRQDGTLDPYSSGVSVDRDGAYRILQADNFTLTPLQYWRDEHGVRWPIQWQLTLTDSARTLVIQAAFPNQRMDTVLVYWEGLVYVLDSDERTIGRGYMELTGY